MNRRGISRTVFLVGDYAIKIPAMRRYGKGVAGVLWSVSRGIQANLSEAQWSSGSGDGVAPVMWSLWGVVNVYPRCEAVGADETVDYATIAPWIPTGDRKNENVGRLHGRLVWIDYDGSWNGCPHSRWAHDLSDEDE